MKKIRITPLNVASACWLCWIAWRTMHENMPWPTFGRLLAVVLLFMIADQIFRFMLRGNNKRLWYIEGGFLIFAAIIIWIIKLV
ncbi:hypothetical protein SAMN05216436_10596 [bacterium A37T11]|nr:hypothetical protein SAMN05216436_10596 [bacterium A37T11]